MRNKLQRLLALGLMLCMALGLSAALAEDERFCSPDEVDLSQVKEEDGRLVGEILLPHTGAAGEHRARLLIDCPVPQPFPEKMQLTVEYKKITQDMLQKAIGAIGQDAEGGTLYQFVTDPLNRMVSFERESELSSSSWARWTTNDLSGHPHQTEMLAAKEMLRGLLGELGIEASEAFLPARRNLVEETLHYSLTQFDRAQELFEENKRLFLEKEKKYGRNGEDDLTFVHAFYELNGLPVMFQYYWTRGGERYGAASEAFLAMRDDGTLVKCSIEGLPVVKDSEPCEVPERSWEDMLRLWVANAYWPASCTEDITYDDDILGEIVDYATYEVLTTFEPCWVGREPFCLEPGWYTLTERRVARDDSLDYTSLGYVAAADMERVF